MTKKILSCLLILILTVIPISVKADDTTFDVAAKHAIAVEQESGKILYEKDSNTPAGIASITKILTVYLVYKEISDGNLTWDTAVPISDYAYNLTANSVASNVPMEARSYTVKDLVNAAMIASANSAAIALAEKIGGSESKFVDKMTQQLNDWGITDAKLVNASGLNNSMLGDNIYPGSSSDDENLMSAKDVAIIARHLVTEFPEILTITSQTSAQFGDTTMTTYNMMLKNMSYYREGVDGLKTGTTELAGASFVATSDENGMRVITVVLNADGWETDDLARFRATNSLLNYVVNTFDYTTIIPEGDSYQNSNAIIKDGKQTTVSAVAKTDLKAVTLKSDTEATTVKLTGLTDNHFAPIKQGQSLGTATFNDTHLIGDGYIGDVPSVELVAETKVDQSLLPVVWWNHFVDYVNDHL